MTDLLQEVRNMELLEAYRLRALRAWDKFDSLHDGWLDQMANRDLEVTISTHDVENAEAFAVMMQQAYFTQYYLMNDCTCKPDSAIACDVCQAQIKAKSTYREEM